jgi:hypothetical protein
VIVSSDTTGVGVHDEVGGVILLLDEVEVEVGGRGGGGGIEVVVGVAELVGGGVVYIKISRLFLRIPLQYIADPPHGHIGGDIIQIDLNLSSRSRKEKG